MLIIIDCCHSGRPGHRPRTRAYGVVELLAACGFESVAPVDGKHCFTYNLVEQLKEDHGKSRKTWPFYTDLYDRLSSYPPSDIGQAVSPIFLRLVGEEDDYSIQLVHFPRPTDHRRKRPIPLLGKPVGQHSALGSGRGPSAGVGSTSQSSIEPPEVDPSTSLIDQARNGPSQPTPKLTETQLFQLPPEDPVRMLHKAFSFPSAKNRYWQIPDAHRETFRWIFRKGHPSGFAEWLCGDGGFYWISGKPGSGKSTLMKKIIESPETTQLLSLWAGKRPLDIVRYFFWSTGTSLQRSPQGCLRSIICQLLLNQPELASQLESRLGYAHQPGVGAWSPTLIDLQTASEFLLRSYDNSRRLCIFIDGLDECDEDYPELLRIISTLANRGGVKICASSREWDIFAQPFAHYPSLCLHTLTKTDIESYAKSSLTDHEGFKKIADCQPDVFNGIVSYLTENACGVFTWVRLTIRLISERPANRYRIDRLFHHLGDMPSEMEDLYRVILDNVAASCEESTLTTLRLFIASQVQVISPTSQIPASEPLLTNVGLLLAEKASHDRELVFREPVESWSEEQIMELEEAFRDQIESTIRGLLSVQPRHGDRRQSPGQLISYIDQTARVSIEKYVQDHGRMIDDDFDPELLLLESSVIRLKKLDMSRPSTSMKEGIFHLECWALVDEAMSWASRVQSKNTDRMIRVLCELDKVMIMQFESWSGGNSQGHWSRVLPLGLPKDQDWKSNFLSLAIGYGIFHFVENQIGQLANTKEGRPLLDYALLPNFMASVDPRIVHLLVAAGADPNDVFCGETVLNRFRESFRKLAGPPSLVQADELASLRDLLEFLEQVSQEKRARPGWVFLSWGLLCLAILVMTFAMMWKV